jgi:hypothetical protein
MTNDRPTDFALKIPDAASQEAAAVELICGVCRNLLRETGDPSFVINALFGATVTMAHETQADPWRLQTAFRKMGEMVHNVYAQRDRVKTFLNNPGLQ